MRFKQKFKKLISACAATGLLATAACNESQVEFTATEEAFPGRVGEVKTGLFPTAHGLQELTYELIDGVAVVEGDIIMQAQPLEPGFGLGAEHLRIAGATRNRGDHRWPGGVVPYTIDPSLTDITEVDDAIDYWEGISKFSFVERTAETDYVTFRDSTGCSASVGRVGGQQFVNLASGCSLGNTIHELGHTLGLWHEQSRTDRDNNVIINFGNIVVGKEHNFQTYVQRLEDGRNSGPYEIGSIMHYGSFDFSANGQPTITKLDGTTFFSQRSNVTATDLCAINRYQGWGQRSDLDNDGYADLVIGVPLEDVAAGGNEGAINILYGGGAGLGTNDELIHRNTAGIEDTADADDRFGFAVATGDFDGDCYADIAVGVPYDDVDGLTAAGSVHVIYNGVPGKDEVWAQGTTGVAGEPGAFDNFGSVLAVGDFNGDGYDDLAVGAPGQDIGTLVDVGTVSVLYGSANGLTATGSQMWNQNVVGIQDICETGDRFGAALAAGDINGDGFEDLAIGVPNEDISDPFSVTDSGAVMIIFGSIDGLDEFGEELWHENVANVPDSNETNDLFGFALALGDFDSDGHKDLAVGVPLEDANGFTDAGAVTVLFGGELGLTGLGSQTWNQAIGSMQGDTEISDVFGRALESADFDGDGYADLAIGVPYDDVGGANGGGQVAVMYGTSSGLSDSGNDLFNQDTAGIDDAPDENDLFGYRLRAGDFDGDNYPDLAIGVPDEDFNTTVDAGAVHVLYSSASGVSATGDQYFTQNTTDILDSCEANDSYGYGL